MDPDREARIRQRAYEIWQSEGRPEGRDVEHWQRAEAEIMAEAGAAGEGSDRAPAGKPQSEPPAAEAPPLRRRASGKPQRSVSETVEGRPTPSPRRGRKPRP